MRACIPMFALCLALPLGTLPLAGQAHGPMSHAEHAGDIDAIRALLMATFDRPDAPLTVDPVVVAGDDAIAAWQQGGNGGRALLRRTDGQWAVWLCAGDEVLDPAFLAEHGVTAEAAAGLSGAARGAEAALGTDAIARLDAFEGVVLIAAAGDGAAHGHAHGHGHAPAASHGAHGAAKP
ncbi:MAG: copper uptake system-associated protein [Rhodobacteraceae bacterium]|jgi:hypothetical protein|nr:copper uptake system-associated protein [Paracoccaceae bacterium]